jgi:hypothetical protein
MDQLNTEQLPQEVADMLPDEVKQLLEIQKEKRLQQVEAIGVSIASKRDEAVRARAASGIEDRWEEDQESYEGIDDANRGESRNYKPSTMGGSFVSVSKKDASRSTVFLNITRPYVDAAAARVADMLMPTDDRNWGIKPTPIPDMAKSLIQQQVQQLGQQAPQGMPPGMPQGAPQGMPQQPPGMGPQGMPQQPQPPADPRSEAEKQLQMIEDQAKERAEKAEKRIEDWLVQCQWHAEMRKAMEDCARLGTGIMKGPTPVRRKSIKFIDGQMTMSYSLDPESKRVDPWSFYPDPSCGENIHNGAYVFEKDDISVRQLRDLKGVPGYLAENIDRVIEEGPGKSFVGLKRDDKERQEDHRFEVWYYYGILDKDDMEALDVDTSEVSMEGVPAIVTLVNDSVIKASLNPLDSGDFPYDVIPWQRVSGSWAGVGVGRQIRTPQRMVNAATRNLMDNAGLSGSPMLVVRRNLIEPADQTWNLTPRKIFYVKEDADVRTVADAITSIVIPSMQGELSAIIQFALKMAEDVTGLPMIMQGQQGQAPDTVGGMQMMQNNAGTVLRRIARSFDDCITEPHIRRYYNWLMQYGEDDEKGDFQIDARGSSALVERDLQNQNILQMAGLVANPAFGIDPEKWFMEACKAQRLDPKRFMLDEEKKAQMAQMQPPPPPQLAVAQIRAETEQQKMQMQMQRDQAKLQLDAQKLQLEAQDMERDFQIDQMRIQSEMDRDGVYVQSEVERTRSEHEARMAELQMKLQLAQLDYANKHALKLEEVKAKLAETAMKLNVQQRLAGMSTAAEMRKNNTPQVATPAMEPPGRAPNGQAFQR